MDTVIIGVAFVIAVVSTLLAYNVGGRIWVTKFAIRGPINSEGRRVRPLIRKPISGLYGEIAALSMVMVILFMVNLVTEETGIWQLLSQQRWFALALFVTVVLIVVCYEIYACKQAKKQGKGQRFVRYLARGYVPYTFYSIVNFAAVILIVGLIVGQTFVQHQDYKIVERQLEVLTEDINASEAPPATKMVLTEQIYSKVREGASLMVDQINTLVLLVFCSFGAQYLVKHTRIKDAFEADALVQFDVLLGLSIGIIVVYAWSVHFFIYDGFFGKALDALENNREYIASGGWQMLQRFNDLFLDLTQRRGLTGFMISLTNDRGGLLLALGAAGWLIDRHKERISQQVPTQMSEQQN
ncbi:hypothetical protein [Roseovarius sp. EL26]|uniref:hypothetical protein n=1 Tax=Roseovarius sp. EL26 TaxID=2126672 RepID=UPI0013C40841|nr:hypothetical protein [Roseovarius sp. EL26]